MRMPTLNLPDVVRKRFLFYVLFVALIGIWARVVYSVYEQVDLEETVSTTSFTPPAHTTAPDTTGVVTRAPYPADYPDPFAPPQRLFYRPRPAVAATPRPAKAEEPVTAPPLTLQGITGETAMVHGSDDTLHFVGPGDVIDGVTIVRVERDRVLASFNKTSITLTLRP